VAYLNFCDQLVSEFLRDPNLPIARKTEEVSRFGVETYDLLQTIGFGTTAMERVEKYVGRITDTIGQISLGSAQVKEWMENVATLEHSVGITTIAGLMLKNIGVIKPETYHAVGIASFLHDIGLIGMAPEILTEDESKMTPEQIKIFREHPAIGAAKLASNKSLPPGVAKAIEQHHVRINGGFPASKGVLDLSPVAEIIGISEEFFNLMKKAQTDPSINPVEAIKEIASRDYSKTIASGFLRTLKEKS
jgi:HD-GYP domain-containing protein (c-di-GMP phosphodiesterase class II)